jgi:hypothetical protein
MLTDVKQVNDIFTDFTFNLPFGQVGVKKLSLVDPTAFYLWFRLFRPPTRFELRSVRSLFLKAISEGFKLFANCSALDPSARKFAEFVGFQTIENRNGFYILES